MGRNEKWSAVVTNIITQSRHQPIFFFFLFVCGRLNGTYENLDAGNTADALVDFTAGVAETVALDREQGARENRVALFKAIKKAFKRDSLMSASITAHTREDAEKQLGSGLGN